MAAVSISVLGGCGVSVDGRPIDGVPSSFFRMVAYIILSGQNLSVPRHRLSSVLWPDIDRGKANGNLRQVISRIRHFQTELNVQFIQSSFSTIYIFPANEVRCDLLDLVVALKRTDPTSTAALADLYPGDLLVDLGDSGTEFEDWLSDHRSSLRDRVIARLDEAIKETSGLTPDQRARCAEQLLSVDAYSEPAFQALMISAAAHGNHGRVRTVYENCQRRLLHDLGVRPSAETVALYARLSAQKVF